MKTVTDLEMKEKIELSTDHLVMVLCSAEWCAPCKRLKPILEKLSAIYTGNGGKPLMELFLLDIEENPETCKHYGVQGIPTILWFRNGKLASTTVGLQSEQSLIVKIESLL